MPSMIRFVRTEAFDAWLVDLGDAKARARIAQRIESAQAGNFGECRFSVGASREYGHRSFGETNTRPSQPFDFAMNSVTEVLDPGGWEIGLDCRDTSGPDGSVTMMNTELSVVALVDG